MRCDSCGANPYRVAEGLPIRWCARCGTIAGGDGGLRSYRPHFLILAVELSLLIRSGRGQSSEAAKLADRLVRSSEPMLSEQQTDAVVLHVNTHKETETIE